jgi:uncharacterized membrane protein
MRTPRLWVLVLVIAGLATARPARAQTGGSMGGGSWSSGSHGSSYTPHTSSRHGSSFSYSSHHSSVGGSPSSSSSPSSYDSSSGDDSPNVDPGTMMIGFLVLFGGIAVYVALRVWWTNLTAPAPLYVTPPDFQVGAVDVTVLRLALDARARPFIQRELARIAGVAKTDTTEGRAEMLREVALMLRRVRDSWVYGGAVNFAMTGRDGAHRTFEAQIADARARFKDEVVRNEQGQVTRADAPPPVATSDDGPGLMVVSVVVAARHELFTVLHIADGEDLRKALESLSTMIVGELVAVEVVWMPADEGERLSSIRVEAAYPAPDLIRIDGALVGKVFCQFCGSPYPAEAVACPNCGGRAAA